MPYITLQVEQNRYNIVIPDIPGQCEMKNIRYWGNQHFQGLIKRAKLGQNANDRLFLYGNAIYTLQIEQNRYSYTWTV